MKHERIVPSSFVIFVYKNIVGMLLVGMYVLYLFVGVGVDDYMYRLYISMFISHFTLHIYIVECEINMEYAACIHIFVS